MMDKITSKKKLIEHECVKPALCKQQANLQIVYKSSRAIMAECFVNIIVYSDIFLTFRT